MTALTKTQAAQKKKLNEIDCKVDEHAERIMAVEGSVSSAHKRIDGLEAKNKMNEFVNWTTLATYGGALAMVLILTQLTKGIGFIKAIPTQLWSYILTLLVLYPSLPCTLQGS